MKSKIYVQQKISLIVCKTLTIESIDIEEDLFDMGLLDSLSLVQLMVAIEEEFEVTISPDELDLEDYKSVQAMSEMINRAALTSMFSDFGWMKNG